MWWTKFHLRKPLSSIILYAIILSAGLISIKYLRFTIAPEGYSPVISIKTQYFGMDSKFIEKNITLPIENAVSSIKGVLNISSVSEDGQSIVTLKINPNRPIKAATLEIKSAVDTIREKFPSDVQEPVISHYDPSQMPVMIISFYPEKGRMSLKEVRRLVEQKYKTVLQKIDGVVESVVTGGQQDEVGIFVNTGRLYFSGMQLGDINRSVQFNNVNNYLGKLSRNDEKIPVFSVGKYMSIYEIPKVSVLTEESNKQKVQELDKLAAVESYHKRIDNISRINGVERVSLYIQKRSDGNVLQICSEIRKTLKSIQIPDLKYEVDFDKSDEINESLGNLISSIIIGIVLLFIIMLIFIGDYKQSLIAIIPLPISISVTFLVANVFQVELNSIIISGIALGSGLLVSDGIIIVEFLSRRKNMGLNRHIISTLKGLTAPLIASLITTICVFLPIVFSIPEIREMYSGFTLMITIMLTVSLFLSLGLVPLAYRMIVKDEPKKEETFIKPYLTRLESLYISSLKWIEERRSFIMPLFVIVILLSGLAIFIKGKGLSSPGQVKEIYAYVEPPTGTSLETTDELTKSAETILMGQKEIKKVIVKVEKAHATIILKMAKDLSEKEVEKRIAQYKKLLSGVDTFIYFTYGDSDNNNKEINIMFIGNNLETIKELCKQASRKLYSMPYFSDVILRFKDDAPLYKLTPNLSKIQISGLTIRDIVNEARIYLYGIISSKLNPEGEGMTDIRITSQLSRDEQATLKDLQSLLIRGKNNQMIPLKELVTVSKAESSSKIYRYNKRRSFTITARIKQGYDLSMAMARVKNEMSSFKFPEGYYWQFDEKYEILEKTNRIMLFAILAAVYLTFVVLVIAYEGFRKAFLTIFVIPFSFIGIAPVLYLFNINLSTPVYIGIILLAGITVHNSVLIMSGIREDQNRIEIYHSARRKMNAINLTTMTTVIGLIPLIFTGGNGQYIWKPFAITMVFGLIASTVLCLLIIPIVAKKETAA